MGPLGDVLGKLPGFGQLANQVDERELGKVESMIQSMTPEERKRPELIDRSRATRIGRGSGRLQSEVVELVKRFDQMREMMTALGSGKGFPGLPGGGALAGAGGGGFDPGMLLGGGPGGGQRVPAGTAIRRRQQAKRKRKQARKDRKKHRKR